MPRKERQLDLETEKKKNAQIQTSTPTKSLEADSQRTKKRLSKITKRAKMLRNAPVTGIRHQGLRARRAPRSL